MDQDQSMELNLDRATASRCATHQEFEPVRAFFAGRKPALTMEVILRFRGYSRVVLKENPDNYGVYWVNPDAPVPFLWMGMAWRQGDPPGTLPSWGASLEVNGPYLAQFNEGAGGLLKACEQVAEQHQELGLHRFDTHVELALWRPGDWLLEQPDQAQALEQLWAGYLQTLAGAGVHKAVRAFTDACGLG